jgi:hypothetical protein
MGLHRSRTITSTTGFRIELKIKLVGLSLTTSLSLQLLVLSYDKATHNFDLSSTLSPYLLLVGIVYGSSTTSEKMHDPLSILTNPLLTDTVIFPDTHTRSHRKSNRVRVVPHIK